MSTMNAGKTGDSNLQDDISQLRDDLSQLRQDVSSLANDILGAAREGVSGAVDTAKKRGLEMADSLEEQIVDHPLASVATAFGIGLLVGAILRRS